MSDLYLIILSAVIFTAWMGYFICRYGLSPSISHYYYELPEKFSKVVFFGFFLSFTVPLILIESVYLFVASLALWYVAAAAGFKDGIKITATIHYGGAIATICIGLLGAWIECGYWYLVLIYLGWSFVISKVVDEYTIWIELAAIVIILTAYIFKLQ